MTASLHDQATSHLQMLCRVIGTRPVGSAGNRAATAYVAEQLAKYDFTVSCDEFACMDWRAGEIRLTAPARDTFSLYISPYSTGVDVTAPLLVARTEAELAELTAEGAILLLAGELTREQLMPKHFPFYNPEHHQRLIALLERQQPAALIAATDRDPGLAGGISPFPLIEDGDFDIPSAYTTVDEGERLAAYAGQALALTIDAAREPAVGYNLVGRKGGGATRIVFCAHVDAKQNTPGALDNGTGVVALLLLAELFADYAGATTVELVFFNGEDYYSAPGEVLYVAQNAGRFDEIQLAVNIDGAGYVKGDTAYSLYGCPPPLAAALRRAFAAQPGFSAGPEWYQSDHSVFVQQGCPAAAVTSAHLLDELTVHITHTPADRLELVDVGKVVAVARALAALPHEIAD